GAPPSGPSPPSRAATRAASAGCTAESRAPVLRQLRGEGELLARARVRERQPGGVQELALEPVAFARPVLRVSHDRMADRREVHSDLMRAPRLQARVNERVSRQRLDHLEVGAGIAGAGTLDGPPGPRPPV